MINKNKNDINKLPKDWKWVKLGEVCFTTSGGTPSRRGSNFYNGKIPWVKSGELDKGLITDTDEKITDEAIKQSSAKVFPKGTLLIALYGATIGKLAFLGVEAATNQAICGIYKSENIDSHYLYNYLFYKKQKLVNQGIGGAQPNISQTILKNLDIPLPPKSTQLSIVSKIEELFSELDKGIENLRNAQQQLKTYRQSVLKWAFEGKLSELGLTGFQDDKIKIFEKDGDDKILKSSNLKNPNSDKRELPKGWKWVKMSEISESILGKMLDKQKNAGTFKPYLRNINVRWNRFKLDDISEMRFQENEDERFGIVKGDLIVCEGGEPGRAAIWKGQIPNMKIQKALHRVRFDKSAKAEYLLYYLNLISSTKQIDTYFTGTTIKHLTGQSLKKIPVPLPSIEEQDDIIQAIESRLSVADKMEESITQSLQQAEALKQSILKRAFEGKLVC